MTRAGTMLGVPSVICRVFDTDTNSLLAALAMGFALAIPVAVLVGLIRVSWRRLSGRRNATDRLLGGVARAGVHWSHLQAQTPDVGDIAVPLPARRRDRRRRNRSGRSPGT